MDYCGVGTKLVGDQCVIDYNTVGNDLIDNNIIKQINGETVFIPEEKNTIILPTPQWYIQWTDNKAFSCQTLISKGVCNISGNNCHAPCRCADCAGWRGGNATDCNTKEVDPTGRVWCNQTPGPDWSVEDETDKCQCEYGYCAVNGLCVSPYEIDSNTETKCCPPCVYTPEKYGGCAGSVKCDTSNPCKYNTVELPGVKINVDPDSPSVTINDRVSENETDVRLKYPHVIVTNPQAYQVDENTAAGQNEFQCAMDCGNQVGSQVDCSKRCLPKLWKWLPVFERDSNGLRFTGGFYQTDQLIKYTSDELRHCPDQTCETNLNVPDIAQFNNCSDCGNCSMTFSSYNNSNFFNDVKYTCDNCEQCVLDQISVNNLPYQVICKDMVDCSNCTKYNELYGYSENKCDNCNGPGQNCKVYTSDPYTTNNQFHPQSQIYNKGTQYKPQDRASGCDFGEFSIPQTCQNDLDGKIAWADGGFFSPVDCTVSCSDDLLS